MSKALVPLAQGFEEIEAISIIDILRRAEIDVMVASLNENTLVQGAHTITVQTDCNIKDISSSQLDMIVLPGGWDGTHALADNTNVQRILKEMNDDDKNIAAICAAPYALNKAGVLKNRYTCYPSVEEEINKEGYQGEKEMVIEDENILTSRGPATAICFALEIVKKLQGEEIYKSVKSEILATYC